MPVIKTQNLTKKFKDLVAVAGVDLEIQKGECFGLLGPNGAGKTTLIRMLTAVTPPSAGWIDVLGYDLEHHHREAKARLGIVPQHDNLDTDIKVVKNLMNFARYFDIPAPEAQRRSLEILHFFDLDDKLNSAINELSGGMKRRLLIARSLINNPSIIVLDEPTTGLDPHAKYMVWQKLTDLKGQGITQILCTQNMEEASYLCDRVAIMDQGKFLCLGAPHQLVKQYAGELVWEIWLEHEDRQRIIEGLKQVQIEFRQIANRINLLNADDAARVRSLLSRQDRLRQRPANLEDVFMILTGRSLEE